MGLKSALARITDTRDIYVFLSHCSADDFSEEELDDALERYGYEPRRYLNKIDKLQALINHFRPQPKKKKSRSYLFE